MSFSERQDGQPVDAETNRSKVKTAQKHRRRSSRSCGVAVDGINVIGLRDDLSVLGRASVVWRDSTSDRRFTRAIVPHIRGDPEAMFARARIASACNDGRDGLSRA